MIENFQVEIKKRGEHYIDDDSVALKRLLRLIEITSNPKLIDDRYVVESGKEIVLNKLLEEIVKNNEKCIVWTNFIDNVDYFCEKYNTYGARKIHGSMSMDARNKSVEIFNNDNECKVLFATPQAAKEGLTLTVANNVIFYDRGLNLDDYLQAQDRIHRISQKKKCYIYNLLIKNSVDEWIDKLLIAKQYAAFLAQGDISSAEYSELADYSYGKIIQKILFEEEQ